MRYQLLTGNRFFTTNLVKKTLLPSSKPSGLIVPTAHLKASIFPNFTKNFLSTRATFQSNNVFTHNSSRGYPTWRDLGNASRKFDFRGAPRNSLKPLGIQFGFFVATSVGMYYGFPILFQIPPFTVFNQNPQLLVYGIILANIAVFFLWKNPRLYSTMNEYFLLHKPLRNFTSLIGSLFSHQETWHLGFNMLMLYSFGGSFVNAVGPSFFMFMYCSSAIFSSLVSLAYPVLLRMYIMAPSLGASGALFSLFSTVAYLFPKTQLSVMFIPFPGGAWTLLMLFTALNLAGLVLRWGGMDYAAHLGGTAIGVFFGWLITEKKKKQRKQRRRQY